MVIKPKFAVKSIFVIATFYKFYEEKSPIEIQLILKKFLLKNNILGTILVANEGINGSVCGKENDIENFYVFLEDLIGDVIFKESYSDFAPFGKLKVKIKPEIVTLGKKITSKPGKYIKPSDWDKALNDPNTIVVDTRNDYEYHIGTFKNAINPNTKSFREITDWANKITLKDKNKKILMFCTGGIRCEKSTALIKDMGFENVYHLEGGIIAYLAEFGKNNKSWKGNCFVFDERIIVDENLDS